MGIRKVGVGDKSNNSGNTGRLDLQIEVGATVLRQNR